MEDEYSEDDFMEDDYDDEYDDSDHSPEEDDRRPSGSDEFLIVKHVHSDDVVSEMNKEINTAKDVINVRCSMLILLEKLGTET